MATYRYRCRECKEVVDMTFSIGNFPPIIICGCKGEMGRIIVDVGVIVLNSFKSVPSYIPQEMNPRQEIEHAAKKQNVNPADYMMDEREEKYLEKKMEIQKEEATI